MVERVRIWRGNDDTAVRVGGIEILHAEEVNLYILTGDDRVGIGPKLPIGRSKAERFVEGDGLIEIRAWEAWIRAFVRHLHVLRRASQLQAKPSARPRGGHSPKEREGSGARRASSPTPDGQVVGLGEQRPHRLERRV